MHIRDIAAMPPVGNQFFFNKQRFSVFVTQDAYPLVMHFNIIRYRGDISDHVFAERQTAAEISVFINIIQYTTFSISVGKE